MSALRRRGIIASGGGGSPFSPPAMLVTPPGFIVPFNFTTLSQDWHFNGGSLPSPWVAITDTANAYTPSPVTFNPSVVAPVMTGSACELGIATGGSETYVGSAIATITGGIVTGTPTYSMQYGHIRFNAQMPSFSGGANATGIWPALWMVNQNSLGHRVELDVLEQNQDTPNIVYSTLHGNSGAWQTPPGNGSPITVGFNSSAGFHWYGAVKEPGMVTWEIDGTVVAQYTATQAAAVGQTWDVDAAAPYPIVNTSLATGSSFSTPWNTANNSQLPNVATLLSEVQVWS